MKKIKNILLTVFTIGTLLITNSCVNDFLDIQPKNLQTEKTLFKTYDNFLTYSWGLYASSFPTMNEVCRRDDYTPWLNNNMSTNGNVWAYQRVTEGTGNNEWHFDHIRRCNIMLDNIEQSQMNDVDKGHWRSVGLFFRSYNYFRLLSFYGDVPWAEHTVKEGDTIVFGPRDSRDVVAANILRDLQYAELNIKPDGDGTNTINVHAVRALISRFGLFEGTWRKYHELENANIYLNACIDASEKLMQSFTELHDNYDELFNTQDLTGMKGVILFRQYALNVLTHDSQRNISRASGSSYELSKEMVNLYLCSDGKPISISPLYDGDKSPFDEFRNRDYRLLFTVLPPSRVYKPGTATSLEWRFLTTQDNVKIGANPIRQVTKEDSVVYREYIDLLAKISKPQQKRLPFIAWNNTLATSYTPRFRNFSEGIAPSSGKHGYWYWKYYDTNPPMQSSNSQDMPIFRIEETMLNYAEAKYELGQFTQDVADRTINKIRARVNVANMNVTEIDDKFDLQRDQTVPPILWEIRRERMVELIGESFLFNDIRRWKKGEYYNTRPKGMWVKNVDYNNTLMIEGYPSVAASKDKEGYVVYLDEPKGWIDHYYLFPIPLNDLVKNPLLKQNPGYASPTSK